MPLACIDSNPHETFVAETQKSCWIPFWKLTMTKKYLLYIAILFALLAVLLFVSVTNTKSTFSTPEYPEWEGAFIQGARFEWLQNMIPSSLYDAGCYAVIWRKIPGGYEPVWSVFHADCPNYAGQVFRWYVEVLVINNFGRYLTVEVIDTEGNWHLVQNPVFLRLPGSNDVYLPAVLK